MDTGGRGGFLILRRTLDDSYHLDSVVPFHRRRDFR